MSKQKFTAIERKALWLAYNKKCIYSGELIDMRDMHIDHIIPESLVADKQAFEKTKEELQLPVDFNIYGLENLLPCKPAYNLLKKTRVFQPAQAHYFLGLADGKKSEIENNILKIEKQLESGRAAILLQSLLESGKLSASEVATILETHAGHPEDVFKLIESLEFFDTEALNEIRKSEINDLKKKQVKLGANDHIDGVELHKTQEDTVCVQTCKQYDAAIKAGYYAATTYAMKMASFFEHQCGLLSALSKATLAEISFINNPRVGITDLDLLPIHFFPFNGDNEEEKHIAGTYQDHIENGHLVIKRLKGNLLLIEKPGGMGQQLIEVARADFNGDGIEDILLFEYCYATKGSMGYGYIRIITRKTEEGLFEDI